MLCVPTLLELSLDCVATHISQVTTLQGLPEELVTSLFALILRRGALSPRVLALFKESGHQELLGAIQVRPTRVGGFWATHGAVQGRAITL